ncbi:hypothetical protein B6V75_00215 [Thioclava sp. F1Mire-8]|uniref:hypothetical protein n=1 Tax=Thioclava sp. F1Mire-8 TaxID=1973006 RepID=UPI000B543D34|nr:hypothetical protein [Thioclava sp. F1Mire-8]OWY04617.1 hypothetical protein B6V75_00215 [Thioclava sp. F1Mire-8]
MRERWLKKYTKIKYLEGILRERQLHLSSPSEWDDKNDSMVVKLYSNKFLSFDAVGTCLTGAPDRFHFWHIFGEREQGVCLWFERKALVNDIKGDTTLSSGEVLYRLPEDVRFLEDDQIPFAKREQYQDECEFRVLRTKKPKHMAFDKFSFSALSLQRIYLNPWLSRSEVTRQKRKISDLLKDDLAHVKVWQNRTLRKRKWIDAVAEALEGAP